MGQKGKKMSRGNSRSSRVDEYRPRYNGIDADYPRRNEKKVRRNTDVSGLFEAYREMHRGTVLDAKLTPDQKDIVATAAISVLDPIVRVSSI